MKKRMRFFNKPKRATAIAITVALTALFSLRWYVSYAQEAYVIKLDENVVGENAGLSVFVSGPGVEKVDDTTYMAEPGSIVTITAINESRIFTDWELTGIAPNSATNPSTTFVMPTNAVAVDASSSAANAATDVGKTMSLSYTISDFHDFFALQEIIAKASITAAEITTYNNYLSEFGLSCTTTTAYTTARNKLMPAYYRVTSSMSVTQPKPADQANNDSWVPTQFFRGLGTSANPFKGVIDGGNHLLTITINDTPTTSVAYGAGIVAFANGTASNPAIIRNMQSYGSIMAEVKTSTASLKIAVGGIVGNMGASTVMYNCTSKVNIIAKSSAPSTATSLYVGGLVGYSDAGFASGSNNVYAPNKLMISAETNTAAYVGGCYGYVNNAYILDGTARLDHSKVNAYSTGVNTSSLAVAGGIVGYYNYSNPTATALKGCSVSSSGEFTVNATIDGSTTARCAYSGGIAGYVRTSNATGVVKISKIGIDADQGGSGGTSAGRIIARDLTGSSNVTVYAGGLFGRVDNNGSNNGIVFSDPIGGPNGSDGSDVFHGGIYIDAITYGLGNSYAGGICGYGSLFSGPLAFDMSDVHLSNVQKNTTSGAGVSYTGGFVGGTITTSVNIENITLYGNNFTVEGMRESGATGNTGAMYSGGIIGYKSGGTINNCRLLLTNSKVMLNQNSYQSKSGNAYLGGLAGYTTNVQVLGCVIAGAETSPGVYDGGTTEVSAILNTAPGLHGVADCYMGGIVGNISGGVMSDCQFIGDPSSEKDMIKLFSNHAANSPSAGGLTGFAMNGVKIRNCTVSGTYVMGDGYNNDIAKTDTDIIVGGLVGLQTGNTVTIDNCNVFNNRIEANGRDYTLTYAGCVIGSGFSTTYNIKGCIVEGNELVVTAQKKWGAGGGVIGYLYDQSAANIDNCLVTDTSITVTSAGTDPSQSPYAIGGGLIGTSSALIAKITLSNSFTNAKITLTHVNDAWCYRGGLIGWRSGLTQLTATNAFYHIQNVGTDLAVGGTTASQTTMIAGSGLDFAPRSLDLAVPKRVLFPTGLGTGNSQIVTASGQPHTISYLTSAEMIEGVSANNRYKIEKNAGMSGVGTSDLNVSITRYDPLIPANVLEKPTRYFGTITALVSDTASTATSIALHEGSDTGPVISTANANTHVSLKIDPTSAGKREFYAITDLPTVSSVDGSMVHPVIWKFYDGNGTPIAPAALTQCGVTISIDGNKLTIHPNVPINALRTFSFQAVHAQNNTLLSDKVTVDVEPIYVQSIKLSSYLSPEHVVTGSIDDPTNPVGSAGNPLLVLKNSTLKMNAQVLGEGSFVGSNGLIEPTIKTYIFQNAELVSGKAGVLTVYADGTIFTGPFDGITDAELANTVYRVKAVSVGTKADGTLAETNYIYIQLCVGASVDKRTTGTILKTDISPQPTDDVALVGGNIDGSNMSLLMWNADYVFTTSPQAGYGGIPEVYYAIGSGPYEKIEIGAPNSVAYGTLLNANTSECQFTIKANPALTGDIHIAVKYFLKYTVVFYPRNGDLPILLDLPIGIEIGAAIPVVTRVGYTFDGWFTTDIADNDAAYGLPLMPATKISPGIAYYAKWTIIPCVVAYDANTTAATGTVPASVTYDYGDSVLIEAAMTRTGYRFVEWTTDPSGTGTAYAPGSSVVITEDVRLYAQWEAKAFDMLFDANGGVAGTQASMKVTYDAAVGALPDASPQIPSRAGYTFHGWSYQNGANNVVNVTAADVYLTDDDTTVYAVWSNNDHTVTYDPGTGGSGNMTPNPDNVKYDHLYVVRGNGFAKNGYTFARWNTDIGGTGSNYAAGDTITIAGDLTLFAQWSAIPYSITYDGNGNTGGTAPIDTTVYTIDDNGTVVGEGTLERTHYTFAGWNTDRNGAGSAYQVGDSISVQGHVILYAQWTAIPYSVTYDGNGNTGGTDPQDSATYTVGQSATVLGAGFLENQDHVFNGWNTERDGSGTYYQPNSAIIMSGNVTLYAQWNPNYYVTYDGNGHTAGTAPTDSIAYVGGDTVSVQGTATLERTGYSFVAWNTAQDGSGLNYAENATFVISANTTLFAQWAPIPYRITYDGNTNTGGSAPYDGNSYIIYDIANVADEGSLTKTGYTFAGWNTSANGSGMAHLPDTTITMTQDLTLFAQWTPIPYTVRYDGNGNSGGSAPVDSTIYHIHDLVTTKGAGSLVKTKAHFIGWNTQSDGTGTAYAANDSFSMLDSDVVLYAQWTPVPHTVSYDGNGNTRGSVPKDPTIYYVNNMVTTKGQETLAKTGCYFTGWNTEADGTGDAYAANASFKLPDADVVLYAQWKRKPHSITYHGNGNTRGSAPVDSTIYYADDMVTAKGRESLGKTGSAFTGWNTQADGTGIGYEMYASFPMPDADVVLYAQWSEGHHAVIYEGNGHTSGNPPVDSGIYNINDQITVADQASLLKTGCRFLGWSTQANSGGTVYQAGDTLTMPAGGITLYAQWEEDPNATSEGDEGTDGRIAGGDHSGTFGSRESPPSINRPPELPEKGDATPSPSVAPELPENGVAIPSPPPQGAPGLDGNADAVPPSPDGSPVHPENGDGSQASTPDDTQELTADGYAIPITGERNVIPVIAVAILSACAIAVTLLKKRKF